MKFGLGLFRLTVNVNPVGFIFTYKIGWRIDRAIRRSGRLEFLWERPMTLALVILALVLLVAPFLVDKLKIRDRLMSK